MHAFKTVIQKFANKGEKTGWTYIDIPHDILLKLKLKNKKEFRVKGIMDDVPFEKMAVFPIGDGNYIMALNAELRKKLGKKEGAMLSVKLTMDTSPPLRSQELLDCLAEDKPAQKVFNALLPSHQNYHHKYVDSAKTEATRAGRIVNVINAMYKGQDYGEMIRSLKKKE